MSILRVTEREERLSPQKFISNKFDIGQKQLSNLYIAYKNNKEAFSNAIIREINGGPTAA